MIFDTRCIENNTMKYLVQAITKIFKRSVIHSWTFVSLKKFILEFFSTFACNEKLSSGIFHQTKQFHSR